MYNTETQCLIDEKRHLLSKFMAVVLLAHKNGIMGQALLGIQFTMEASTVYSNYKNPALFSGSNIAGIFLKEHQFHPHQK